MPKRYQFALKYQLAKVDCQPFELIERLGAGGCTDALIGSGVTGQLTFRFTRQGLTVKDAVLSAMTDIYRVIPTATLIDADPSLFD